MAVVDSNFDPVKFFQDYRGFTSEKLSSEVKDALVELGALARGSLIKMTTTAGSGHPGGSMSSMEMYLLLYCLAKLDPKSPWVEDRDRIIISHGHTSPGVYAALGHNGFFNVKDAEREFRLAGSPFEGHVERSVPGVEWDTGNLGQGLSVGCGKAVAAQALGKSFHTFVVMGDGEQQKGQIAEARRFAAKLKLNSVTALIDLNHLQISGNTKDVMPQQIADGWRSDGWNVVDVDGHNLDEVYAALKTSYNEHGSDAAPTVIIAHTVMGKGYPAIENDFNYHGAALKPDQAREAFAALGLTQDSYDDLDALAEARKSGPSVTLPEFPVKAPNVQEGAPRTYEVDKMVDNRSAWGNALVDIGKANNIDKPGGLPCVVYDCDLAVSVKTAGFAKEFPGNFMQYGIAEHSTCASAGATSAEGVLTFWSDFGVFGVSETYNQSRLNDINHANLKIVCTHCGLDVGEDGKTHQCIDYFALSRSVFGWRLFTPADPNQTDRIVRHISTVYGNALIVMGRSKMNPISAADGSALFGGDYKFHAGRTDLIRDGEGVTIFCAGNVAIQGLAAYEALRAEGINVRLISSAHWADFHEADLNRIAEFGRIVTVEDHNVNTGIGVSLSAELFAQGLSAQIIKLGVSSYGPSGKSTDVYKLMGIDSDSIARAAKTLLTQDHATHIAEVTSA